MPFPVALSTGFRLVPYTVYPLDDSLSAVAFPNPDEAPVINTTLFIMQDDFVCKISNNYQIGKILFCHSIILLVFKSGRGDGEIKQYFSGFVVMIA